MFIKKAWQDKYKLSQIKHNFFFNCSCQNSLETQTNKILATVWSEVSQNLVNRRPLNGGGRVHSIYMYKVPTNEHLLADCNLPRITVMLAIKSDDICYSNTRVTHVLFFLVKNIVFRTWIYTCAYVYTFQNATI